MSFVVLKPYCQPEEFYPSEALAEKAAIEYLNQNPAQEVFVAKLVKSFKATVKVASGELPTPNTSEATAQ